VAICIPTYRRPIFLGRLLQSVTELRADGLSTWTIVIDNDAAGSAEATVRPFMERIPGLVYEIEPETLGDTPCWIRDSRGAPPGSGGRSVAAWRSLSRSRACRAPEGPDRRRSPSPSGRPVDAVSVRVGSGDRARLLGFSYEAYRRIQGR
jgi:hypothetical protein